VYVTGAVKATGKTVELPAGSRVEDAINAAGGATDKADLQRVNLAEVVTDGMQVNVPAAGEVIAETTAQPSPTAVVSQSLQLVQHIVSLIPPTIQAGTVEWRQDRTIPIDYLDLGGATAARITFGESGGGQMEVTYAVFDTPDAATAYYNKQFQSLKSQSQTEQRDGFPTPNAFGRGTYGSGAIFVRDNIFVKVSVPRFSSTQGDPLTPSSKQVFSILDSALASFSPK
jgi:hypothetical protein